MTLCYLSGPIIDQDNRKDSFYQCIVDYLGKAGVDVFAPQMLGPAEPVEVFRRDTRKVREADFLIAEVSNASHGVGMELMLSIELGIPLLLFRHTDANPLSYMVSGASGTALFEYNNLEDVRAILQKIDLHDLLINSCDSCNSDVAAAADNMLHCIQCGAELPM